MLWLKFGLRNQHHSDSYSHSQCCYHHLNCHDHFAIPLSPPAPLNTSSLPVSWPGLSPLTSWSPWQLAGSGWPQPASDQALWPAGQLSGEAGIQCTVFVLFLRKSCKHIYSRGLFREPLVASRFGARLAEQKKTGRPRLVLPEANKKYYHILQ